MPDAGQSLEPDLQTLTSPRVTCSPLQTSYPLNPHSTTEDMPQLSNEHISADRPADDSISPRAERSVEPTPESLPQPLQSAEPPPPPKVKLSLKDFAMRKKKQREERQKEELERAAVASPEIPSKEPEGVQEHTTDTTMAEREVLRENAAERGDPEPGVLAAEGGKVGMDDGDVVMVNVVVSVHGQGSNIFRLSVVQVPAEDCRKQGHLHKF